MNTNKSQAEQLPQDAVMQSVLKGQHLRIGNLVNFNGNNKEIGIVSEILKNDLTKVAPYKIGINHRIDIYYDIDKLKPIQLTEEWLIKLGFTWSIAHQGFFKKDFYYVIDFYETYPKVEGCIAFLNKNHRNGEKLLSVKYVHQLQNLYFVLTQGGFKTLMQQGQ